ISGVAAKAAGMRRANRSVPTAARPARGGHAIVLDYSLMSARVIDGHQVAKRIREEVRDQVGEFAAKGCRLKLAAVLVGDSPASQLYVKSQSRQCSEMGIQYQLVQLPAHSQAADIGQA